MQDFLEFLRSLREGEAIEEYAEALREASEAVSETRKMAQVQLTIKLKPAGKSDVVFEIEETVTTKLPSRERGSTILFRDARGRFTRRDPRQPELPIRPVAEQVDPETGEIREAHSG